MTAPRMLLTALCLTWLMVTAAGGAAAASGTLLGTVPGPARRASQGRSWW